MSLGDAVSERSRTFMCQCCEIDDKVLLDKREISEKPAFGTMVKEDAASIQDTDTCGILLLSCLSASAGSGRGRAARFLRRAK